VCGLGKRNVCNVQGETCNDMQKRRGRQKHERAFYFAVSGKVEVCPHHGAVIVKPQYAENCLLAGR
jgi:hypothetical protein